MPISRRAVLSAPALLIIGCAPAAISPERLAVEAALPPSAPTLIYVSAPDCPFCRDFQQFYRPAFEQGPVRAKLRFRELVAGSLSQGHADATWPAELRWVRDERVRRGMRSGTPAWSLVRGDTLLEGAWGLGEWRRVMVPRLEREVSAA